jgi:hypothetical protein
VVPPSGQAEVKITASANAPCEKYHTETTVYPGSRTITPGGFCSDLGDPHFITFSIHMSANSKRWNYDFQTPGYYDVVKSDWLNVQAFQAPCKAESTATCNFAAGINYGSDSIYVTFTSDYKIAPGPTAISPVVKQVSPKLNYINYTQPDGNTWWFNMIDGSRVEIISRKHFVNYININIPASYYGKVKGLCNTYDSSKTLLGSDGKSYDNTVQSQVNEFGATWAVADANNIFKGAYKADAYKTPYAIDGKPFIPIAGASNPAYDKFCNLPPVTTTTTAAVYTSVSSSSSPGSPSPTYNGSSGTTSVPVQSTNAGPSPTRSPTPIYSSDASLLPSTTRNVVYSRAFKLNDWAFFSVLVAVFTSSFFF